MAGTCGAGGDGDARAPAADHDVDLFGVDQAHGGVDSLNIVGLVVNGDQLDLLPKDLALERVGDLNALVFHLAAGGVGARERLKNADLDDVAVAPVVHHVAALVVVICRRIVFGAAGSQRQQHEHGQKQC